MKRAAAAVLLATVTVVAAGCGGAKTDPSSFSGGRATPDAANYESVGVRVTPAPAGYRPSVSRRAVLARFGRAKFLKTDAIGKPTVHLETVNGAYPAWVITFRHPRCTTVFIYDLRARIWTWSFANCLNPGRAATCDGVCGPLNQDALDAAASYAERVAGAAHVFGGDSVDDDANAVILHLTEAPKAILTELRAAHPGIYVIHNDAPRTLHALKTLESEIDPDALKRQGIDVVQLAPTEGGDLQVGVSSSVPAAQAYFAATYGKGIIRVVHAEPVEAAVGTG